MSDDETLNKAIHQPLSVSTVTIISIKHYQHLQAIEAAARALSEAVNGWQRIEDAHSGDPIDTTRSWTRQWDVAYDAMVEANKALQDALAKVTIAE